jgi:hypothetical protein
MTLKGLLYQVRLIFTEAITLPSLCSTVITKEDLEIESTLFSSN